MAKSVSSRIASSLEKQSKKPALMVRASLFTIGLAMNAFIATADAQDKAAKPGTASEDHSQAGAISRDVMLNTSVDSWADRLVREGGTLQEWMKLVRYYGVLGKDKKALAALEKAKIALKDDPQAIRRLVRFSKLVGIKR